MPEAVQIVPAVFVPGLQLSVLSPFAIVFMGTHKVVFQSALWQPFGLLVHSCAGRTLAFVGLYLVCVLWPSSCEACDAPSPQQRACRSAHCWHPVMWEGTGTQGGLGIPQADVEGWQLPATALLFNCTLWNKGLCVLCHVPFMLQNRRSI